MTRSFRHAFVFVLAVGLMAGPASAQIAFEDRTDVSTPPLGLTNPVALTLGDFVNPGDGIVDFAATFDFEDSIGIFQNNQDGTFSLVTVLEPPLPPGMGGPPAGESYVGLNPTGIVTIDLDGDTVQDDIAGVNAEERFFAYENGGGTWMRADPEAGRGNGVTAVVGHWSSPILPPDGCDDLFTANQNGAVAFAISRCDGSGEFEVVTKLNATGEVTVQTDIEVGDFVELGGDAGQVDLLTIDNLQQQIVIWPGDPTIDVNVLVDMLVKKPTEVAGQPVSPVQSIVEDWDADGFLDLLLLVEEGYVLWYRGTRNPADNGFMDPQVFDLAGQLSTGSRQPTRLTSFEYADVVGADGASGPDGIRDLVVADAGQSSGTGEGFNWLWIVPGTGPAPMTDGPPTFDPAVQTHYAAADLGILKPGSLAVADFRGVGVSDILLLAFDASRYTLFQNDGAGGFDAAPSYAAGATGVRGIAGRRLSGAQADVVATSRGHEGIVVADGDGSGALLEPGQLAETASLGLVDAVKLVDLDDDSVEDALVTFRDEHVLYRGVPDGSYMSPEVLADGPRSLTGVSRVGNLGEGGSSDAVDLAIFNPALGNSTLGIWLGDGNGGFALDQQVPDIFGYSTHAVGRFLSGSPLDTVVVAGETQQFASPPQLYVVSADMSGQYSVTATLGFPSPFDMIPSPVKLLISGDFDQNGFDDVVAVLGGGETFYLPSNGTQLTMPATFFSVGSTPRVGLGADLDGDSFPDLAVANRRSVRVLANNAGSFGAPLILQSNIDNAGLTVADLDDDGLPELIAGSERTSDLTVFRNVSTPPFRLTAGPDPTGAFCRFSWPNVSGATFSLVRGNLAALWDDLARPLVDYTETPCALTGAAVTFWDDTMPLPVSPMPALYPDCAFYLVRCEGASCPDLSFGSDSLGMVRYANDPPDPCP